MSYTLRGRLESRLVAMLPPLLVALAIHRWWAIELVVLMLVFGVALDVCVYDRVLEYQPGWLALPLGALELGLVVVAMRTPVTWSAVGLFALTWLGTSLYLCGRVQFTLGMILAAILFAVMWFVLAKTAWGRHVYAVGNEPEAARLTGIHIDRTLVSVYMVAGLIYGFAAWMALGRTPTADPNAYQTGNLDSITAVVIGGTSLFGGRGGVVGTVVGALIVAILRSGLTQMGIDSNYQNLATGVLVIAAVAFDQATRRRA